MSTPDPATRKRLEALAKRARRSASFLAADDVAAFVEAERFELEQIRAGLKEIEAGRSVAHRDVSDWLRSWGHGRERKAPGA